jgi:hypothetical protein
MLLPCSSFALRCPERARWVCRQPTACLSVRALPQWPNAAPPLGAPSMYVCMANCHCTRGECSGCTNRPVLSAGVYSAAFLLTDCERRRSVRHHGDLHPHCGSAAAPEATSCFALGHSTAEQRSDWSQASFHPPARLTASAVACALRQSAAVGLVAAAQSPSQCSQW